MSVAIQSSESLLLLLVVPCAVNGFASPGATNLPFLAFSPCDQNVAMLKVETRVSAVDAQSSVECVSVITTTSLGSKRLASVLNLLALRAWLPLINPLAFHVAPEIFPVQADEPFCFRDAGVVRVGLL